MTRTEQGASSSKRSTARILVVDNDPWIPRVASTILGQQGHVVGVAGDAQGALASALKAPPDVIISTVALPAVEGKPWWERLRSSPEMGNTPFIFLTVAPSSPAEIRGFARAVDGCLTKPFRMEELEKAVRAALERGREAASRGGSPVAPSFSAPVSRPSFWHRPLSAFRGVVDEISLSSLLVMLEMERKTGILVVERDEATARLYLRNGRVIRAEIDAEEDRVPGVSAAYEVLSWNDGLFDFLVGDVGGIDEIQMSTTFLLMEAARRIDETR